MEQTGGWSVRHTQSGLQRGGEGASMRRSIASAVGAALAADLLGPSQDFRSTTMSANHVMAAT